MTLSIKSPQDGAIQRYHPDEGKIPGQPRPPRHRRRKISNGNVQNVALPALHSKHDRENSTSRYRKVNRVKDVSPPTQVTDLDGKSVGTFKVPKADILFERGGMQFRKPISRRDQRKVKTVTGHCWECIGLNKGSAGYTYAFKFDPKKENQFPLAEIEGLELHMHNLTNRMIDCLNFLGYHHWYTGIRKWIDYYTAPDLEQLLYRWNQYRQKPEHKKLPELRIHTITELATDIEYISIYCSEEKDVILSLREGFVHDQQFHIMQLIYLLLSVEEEAEKPLETTYVVERNRVKKLVRDRLNDISYLDRMCKDPQSKVEPQDRKLYAPIIPQLITLLSASIDSHLSILSDISTLREFNKFDLEAMEIDIHSDEDKWHDYFYGDNGRYKGLEHLDVVGAWNALSETVNKYRVLQQETP